MENMMMRKIIWFHSTMRIFLAFATLIAGVVCDSSVLGYELSILETSLNIFKSEVMEDNNALKKKYRRQDASKKRGLKPDTLKDTTFYNYITIYCRIEGVWSVAVAQWNLCLLSPSFAYMKLDHFLRKSPYIYPLPSPEKMEKIYRKEAKYTLNFLRLLEPHFWRIAVLDTFYYTLQRIAINLHSLSQLKNLKAPSTLSKPSNNPPPSNPGSIQSLSPIHNICHTIFSVIPRYMPNFLHSSAAMFKYTNSQKPFDEITIPKDQKRLIIEVCSSIKSSPLPSASVLPPPPPISSHSSLFYASHSNLPYFFLTFHYYKNEIYTLNSHLMQNISLPSKDHALNDTRRFLALIESINISIFSISVFCGPESRPFFQHYAQYDNPFIYFDGKAVFPTAKLTLALYLNMLSFDSNQLLSAVPKQLKALSQAIKCSLNTFIKARYRKDAETKGSFVEGKHATRKWNYNYAIEFMDLFERKKAIQNNINYLEDQWKVINETSTGVRLTSHMKEKHQFFTNWLDLANQCIAYTQQISDRINLEKLYKFPIDYFLAKAASMERNERLTEPLQRQMSSKVYADRNLVEDNFFKTEHSWVKEERRTPKGTVSSLWIDKGVPEGKRLVKKLDIANIQNANQIELEDALVTAEEGGSPLTDNLHALTPDSISLLFEEQYFPMLNLENDESLDSFLNELTFNDIISPMIHTELKDAPGIPSRRILKGERDSPFSIPLLPFPFIQNNRFEAKQISWNLRNSNKGGDVYKKEMQFWLLLNHHPSHISSCFTYSLAESHPDEFFNSSISYPDAISLFVSTIEEDSKSNFYGIYGWNGGKRNRDYRLETMAPFIEFLLQKRRYDQFTEQNKDKFHSPFNSQTIDVLSEIEDSAGKTNTYSRKIQLDYKSFMVNSLITKAVGTLTKGLKQFYTPTSISVINHKE